MHVGGSTHILARMPRTHGLCLGMHAGGHTRILARMPSPITTLAFVNGAANLLFLTSQCGSVYLADLNKPEDSHMSKTKLPHAAKLVGGSRS